LTTLRPTNRYWRLVVARQLGDGIVVIFLGERES
jgi:hypothetical protein